ncbi:MAG: ribonuclease HI [Elusimicrobia bacterium]|nr:ribonuclease HI [Elusimicrobiota bacterium]
MRVFTDGACSGNPGPGGWGAILVSSAGQVRELGGGQARTTNNRMELCAVIAALKALKGLAEPVSVYTDSTYVISGATTWIKAWRRKGWLTAEGKPVLNRDLWAELEVLASSRAGRLSWHYVRGHSGWPGNERCDEIAVAFSKGEPVTLYRGPLSGYRVPVLDVPEDTSVPARSYRSAPKRKGGFYLSYIDGRLERHAAWADCQARVHGKSGARFKRVFSEEEAGEIRRRWGAA